MSERGIKEYKKVRKEEIERERERERERETERERERAWFKKSIAFFSVCKILKP